MKLLPIFLISILFLSCSSGGNVSRSDYAIYLDSGSEYKRLEQQRLIDDKKFDNAPHRSVAGSENGWCSVTLGDGDIYTGQCRDGMQNGHGTYIYEHTKDWYEGPWVNGDMHGTGFMYFGPYHKHAGTAWVVVHDRGEMISVNGYGEIENQRSSNSRSASIWEGLMAGVMVYANMQEAERQRYNSWVSKQNNSRTICTIDYMGSSHALGQVFSSTYGARCR